VVVSLVVTVPRRYATECGCDFCTRACKQRCSNTFSATLTADGAVTFAYDRLTWPFGIVGVAKGGDSGPVNAIDLSQDLPQTVAAGAIFEAFDFGKTLGSTVTLPHETGHDLGLSHPHDGYDWEMGSDFGAFGDSYYT
jgi:hypothetical protein